eukprot:Protomagalhaensia_wolfi_Nauph_80__1229@NODE_1726_length_1376_cov_543_396410_g1279_i1_p3_GENE_NODE_1726_length_1376_cov_543_396410_g1279_i1NODE_1726_length_1376_cov_543_396410_g1279_i1_p3_ORF_typecomplete_len129_score8_47UPF0139/PF03669_13/0_00017PhoR/PF11808_8/2_3PhoR/PF11808_8/1_6e02PhoR/PF11808_8/7_6e02_NODE_1726_length_1376_cov_543_396410_g1279_i1142528
MFEDEPPRNEGKWEKMVDEIDRQEDLKDSLKDDKEVIAYRSPEGDTGHPFCTVITVLSPICALLSFVFQAPLLLYLCPAFVLSSWSLMRNGANKQSWISALTCTGMTLFSHYMAERRKAQIHAADAMT